MQNLLHELNEEYKIPCYNKTISDLKEICKKLEAKIIDITKNLDFVCISSDGWKSVSKDNYFTFHIYYYNEVKKNDNSENHQFLSIRSLVYENLEEDHYTGEILAKYFKALLLKYQIKNIIASTTDGGTNIVSSFKILDINNIHCAAHVINIVVKSQFKEISTIYNKINELVNFFNNNNYNLQVIN